jgi:hypothetical protein
MAKKLRSLSTSGKAVYSDSALCMAIRKWFGLCTMRTEKTFDEHV